MRMMLRARVDTAIGNEAIKSGVLPDVIGKFIAAAKPEAAYFTLDEGRRTAFFVFDMTQSSAMPALDEDMITRLGAEVHITPVMNLEELQTGFAAMPRD